MPVPSKNWPKVFIGITAYSGKTGQRSPYLSRFLESIKEKTTYDKSRFEIVVYDDCSPDNFTEDALACVELDTRLVKGEAPLVRPHLTRGQLMAEFLTTDCEYALLFDDDFLITQTHWLKHMIRCMITIKEIGILGGFWATLEDGHTRQRQHAPIGVIERNGAEVSINNFVCGGCWCVRREVIETLGLPPTDIQYDGGQPGWDTYYHNLMLETTDWKLCCTRADMCKHMGQEFMSGDLKDKYDNPDYKAGKRIY